jgi:cytochrome c oxidase subunit 3
VTSATLPRGRRGDATAAVGMTIFLGATAMLFAALFFAYAVMRAQAPAWPPVGQAPLPRGALGVNTLVLLAATLALHAARAATRRDDRGATARRTAWGALALGAGFLAAQVGVWRALVHAGAGPASGIYGSVFFAISGFHALHVVGGLVALAFVVGAHRSISDATPDATSDTTLGTTTDPTARRLGLVALYWDFVLVVWLRFYLGACLR